MKLKNCSAEEFINSLNGRKVICFGAGSMLLDADFEVRKINELEKHIAFFVDNDEKKNGLKFDYCGQQFDIKNAKTLSSIQVKDYVILITCTFYVEIYNQLKNVEAIQDIDCYMYNAVCSYPTLDVEHFFTKEIEKYSYKEWKQVLSNLKLRNRHKGQRCFIIGNGPSLRVHDLELLNGEITFAANRIFKLFDETNWRPTYYLCLDYLVYGLDHKEINTIDAKLRFVPIQSALAAGEVYDEITYYNRTINYIDIGQGKIIRGKEFNFSDNIEEVIWGGQTVLYDAIQIAVYMGFSEIYLYGVDHDYKYELLEDGTIIEHDVKENHFSESYDDGLKEAIAIVAPLYATKLAFQKGKEECEARGIVIKNATRGGKLDVFERISLDELLDK